MDQTYFFPENTPYKNIPKCVFAVKYNKKLSQLLLKNTF